MGGSVNESEARPLKWTLQIYRVIEESADEDNDDTTPNMGMGTLNMLVSFFEFSIASSPRHP